MTSASAMPESTLRLDRTLLDGLNRIAEEVVEWHDREWPSPDGTPAEIERVAMKLAEEVGELLGAIVKHRQGRTDADWLANARLELGDVAIVLMVLAARLTALESDHAPTIADMIAGRWCSVRLRRGATYRQAS